MHERIIPLLRAFTVFNLAQVDGVPASLQAVERHHWDPDARDEELLQMSGATIHHGGSRAFYRPGDDEIYVERLIDETGSDLGKVLDYFGVAGLTELSAHAASRAITSLEKQRRAA